VRSDIVVVVAPKRQLSTGIVQAVERLLVYADDLLAKNFPEDYAGADRLKVRTTVNQIGQIPAPVAEGVGYTLLPRSGLAAFTEADRLRVAQLSVQRHLDLWAISRRGRVPSARAKAAMAVFREIAKDLA
jgi:DNA-binding transcriptional LysR family regulator